MSHRVNSIHHLRTAHAKLSAPFHKLSGERGVPVTAEPKAGRNDPCPCGSGQKAKRCEHPTRLQRQEAE